MDSKLLPLDARDCLDRFRERSAIAEIDGEQARDKAELMAMEEIIEAVWAEANKPRQRAFFD